MKTAWLLALAACTPAHADSAEKITGTVVAGGTLYASKVRASAAATPRGTQSWAMTVIKDHGDVIEASTAVAAGHDCVAPWSSPYALTVFVRRDALLQRSTREITKTFADGTKITIERGAPIADHAKWVDPILAQTAIAPPTDALAYSLPTYTPSAWSAPKGERLVCSPPQTQAEWTAARDKADAERRRKAPPKPAAPAKDKARDKHSVLGDADNIAAILSVSDGSSMGPPQSCRVSAEKSSSRPTLDGRPLEIRYDWRREDEAYRDGTTMIADVHPACGHLRVRVDAAALTEPSGGSGIGGIGRTYRPKRGPVTWPDGTPAGNFVGYAVYREAEVQQIKGRYCVAVQNVDERVCHRKADVTVSK